MFLGGRMLRKYHVEEDSCALIFLCQFRRIFLESPSNCDCDFEVKNRQTAENDVGSTLSFTFPFKNKKKPPIGKYMSKSRFRIQ